MIVTEEEAKEKRCPEFKSDRHHRDEYSTCIGSKCMMWRTTSMPCDDPNEGDYGYCGKAGKP